MFPIENLNEMSTNEQIGKEKGTTQSQSQNETPNIESQIEKTKFYELTMEEKKKQISIAEHIKSNIRSEMVQACLNVYRAEALILKLFSLLFVIVATSIAAFMIIGTFMQYFKFEVSTNTRTIFETPAPFPKITICSNNQFQTEYAI